MTKTHIYCVPGLAANGKIFEFIKLPKEQFEIHVLEWLMPVSLEETIQEYAARMCEKIKHENVVLLGVSFGGIMVQEMSKIIKPKKVILISSVKSAEELPKRLKITKVTNAYKLFPAKSITTIENFIKYAFGKMAKKRIEQYQMYLSVKNELYLKWAIYNVLHWKSEEKIENIVHIHGETDQVFPYKHIQNSIKIPNASHVMILTKSQKINKIIQEQLS